MHMSRLSRAVAGIGCCTAFLITAASTYGQAKTWDRTANIKSSAVSLAQMQQTKGAMGAFQFIANCYKTHELNSKYGQALEGCLVQDYIHSRITAAVYSKLPPGEIARMGLPVPDEMVAGMLKRLGQAMGKYNITEADARKFVAQVEAVGMPTFAQARFPKAAVPAQ
jgi:hypothetical protein